MSHTSITSGYTDTEALTYAELAADPAHSDSEVGFGSGDTACTTWQQTILQFGCVTCLMAGSEADPCFDKNLFAFLMQMQAS